jgi:Double zinc ribbon
MGPPKEIPGIAGPRFMLDGMAHCTGCGAPTDLSDRFCGRCGKALAGVAPVDFGLSRYCGGCGGSLEADARFCRRCGARAPEPKEDVFAGMPAKTNGHEVTDSALVEDLFIPAPPPPVPVQEAPTESIPLPRQPAPRAAPAPEPEPPPVRRAPAPPPPEEITTPVERAVPTAPLGELLPTRSEEPDADGWESSIPRGAGFPWGGTLALLGALAVIMSAILEWGGSFNASLPRDITAAWLLDPEASSEGPTLGLLLLLAGTLGALVSLLVMAAPGFTFLRRFVGLLTVTIPLAFALRTLQSVAAEGSVLDLPSALEVGVVVAAAGAILQLVAPRPGRA